ncbi:MAG: hypothetical protein BGO12_00070 [Verrucomicrobia bacterium 61-8]|nr:hypothetical protein [Verrucomicrobiota bacterium]OJV26744.1 MAG: hypothetical protein BGO12_00070 [Verrucomicrobia bacterium 61-8]
METQFCPPTKKHTSAIAVLRLVVGATLASGLSVQAATVTSAATGNWAANSTWSTGYAPGTNPSGGTSDTVYVRGNYTVTIDSNVTPTAPGGVAIVRIGEDAVNGAGILQITSGGSLVTTDNMEVMRRGASLSGASGTLTMSGGSLSVGGAMYVGYGLNTQSGNGTGVVNVGGASSLNIAGATVLGSSTAALGSGTLSVTGHSATITGSSSLTVNSFGSINLAFDSAGISTLNFGAVSLASGSTLTINGSLYSGAGGSVVLINGSSLTGTFTNINISGFGGAYGTPSLTYDTANGNVVLNLATVPEPSVIALAVAGGAVLLGALRSRSRRRE